MSLVPTTKTANHRIDDFDLDVAQLGDPLADDALDALSSLCEARDAARDLLRILATMQIALESGRPAYSTREQYALDLEALADTISANVSGILG